MMKLAFGSFSSVALVTRMPLACNGKGFEQTN